MCCVFAASQWAKGYAAGERVYEDVMDMIDREAEGSDSLEVRPDSLPATFGTR